MKMTRRSKIRAVEVVDRQVARRRALTEILGSRVGAALGLQLELDSRWMQLVDAHVAAVDAFGGHRVENEPPERVVADAAHPANAQTEPRESDRDVRFSARLATRKTTDSSEVARLVGD